jgi:hypothetical protein
MPMTQCIFGQQPSNPATYDHCWYRVPADADASAAALAPSLHPSMQGATHVLSLLPPPSVVSKIWPVEHWQLKPCAATAQATAQVLTF